jgi:hypothetical protein
VVRATDVFGHRVKTWQSYYNFKCWFESRACSVPGTYINATEGGILGSYPEGNIEQIKQMAFKRRHSNVLTFGRHRGANALPRGERQPNPLLKERHYGLDG